MRHVAVACGDRTAALHEQLTDLDAKDADAVVLDTALAALAARPE